MKCNNCGKKLKSKEKFCTYCGNYNEETNEESHSLFDEELNLLDESIYETKEEYDYVKEFNLKADSSGTKEDEFFYKDEKYLESYIGEDYKLIKKSPFNIYAFLLNWIYILYRKIYGLGIFGMIITYIMVIINPKYLLIYLLIMMLIIGLTFNKIYIFFSKLKVEFFIKKHQDMDSFAIENKLRKKGGVKVSIALIIYIIFLTVLFFSLFSINYKKTATNKFWTENSNNKATCNSLLKTTYKSLENNNHKENISEGVCKIIPTNNKKEYEITLKIEINDTSYYKKYKSENDYLVFNLETFNIKELEVKDINKTISLEEKEYLDKLKQVEEDYFKIKKDSKKEDLLIKNNKNTSEKKNFVFSKEEITR